MDKATLRENFLKIRRKLSKKAVSDKSEKIIERLISSNEFQQSEKLHCYISILKNNEVHTHNFIEFCFSSNKTVIVPKIKPENELAHIRLQSMDQLSANNWGVMEPAAEQSVSPDFADLIIIPMVAGDKFKNRLGYGMGFYDRFLKQTTAIKAGLLFDCQLFHGKLPVQTYDIPMDFLITESRRIN